VNRPVPYTSIGADTENHYGFAAVQASLKDLERFHAEGHLARTMVKSLFRVIDHIPPLKPMFLGR
jgi:hypothetical protein